MTETTPLAFGGKQLHIARSPLWACSKREGTQDLESAYFSGGVRAAADIVDYYVVKSRDMREGSAFLGISQGVVGLGLATLGTIGSIVKGLK